MRLAYVGSPELRDMLGDDQGDRDVDHGFARRLSPLTDLEVSQIAPGGWSATLDALRVRTSGERFSVLVTSASAELADPSEEPREALIELARSARESDDAHVVVLNCSSLLPTGPDDPVDRSGDPVDLRIRRLNLVIMEASNVTGLSVLDADRLVAEARLAEKFVGPFRYAPEIRESLRSTLASILGDLGFARRAVMEARVPFISRAMGLSLERWLKSEGEAVATGDVLCELRLNGLKRMTRATSAVVLASINHRVRGVRRLATRERIGRRRLDATISLVACDSAVLRRLVRQPGEAVGPGDPLAVFGSDAEGAIEDPEAGVTLFRTLLRSDDPSVEALL